MTKTLLNFCPISVLNCFSKVYENILKTQVADKMNNLFFPFISFYAYGESNNTQHVLIRFVEEWRKNLETIITLLGLFLWTFDCIPCDLVIAKLVVYGFDKNMISYIYSYLKSRKQYVSVNNIKSTFEETISGVPHFVLLASAHNFEDDNSLSSFAKTIENLISILESESEIAINWFKNSHMIVNPGKLEINTKEIILTEL